MKKENRQQRDAVVNFGLQTSTESLDSITCGSMGVRFGAQVALPFYTQFKTEEEIENFCKDNLQPFIYINKIPICIIWDSTVGKKLISTFLLSENVIFIIFFRLLYYYKNF